MRHAAMMTSSNENISSLLAFCVGNSPVTGDSPHKDKRRGALIFSLICAWIDGWVNNREAGDVIRHRAHYDVTVRAPVPASHRGATILVPSHVVKYPCNSLSVAAALPNEF